MSSRLSRHERSARAIAELIEQLSRTTANSSFVSGLNPAQWAALRYIARANEAVRNVGAFAQHHMITPSSASQTIQALVRKGLISKKPGEDRRSRYLALTIQGERMLKEDPINKLASAIVRLSGEQLSDLASILAAIMNVPASDEEK